MKLCISSEGASLDSRVDPRFGRIVWLLKEIDESNDKPQDAVSGPFFVASPSLAKKVDNDGSGAYILYGNGFQ